MNWESKKCLVTGASSGIGWDLCQRLAEKGATVIGVARREERLERLIDSLGGPPHRFFVCDVSDLSQIRSLAKSVEEASDSIDILVNNAGIPSRGPITRNTSEDMEKVIRTNLLGPMWMTKELLPLLAAARKTSRAPVIVNVSSMMGKIALPKSSDYVASKFGLSGFTESLWGETDELGIRAILVCPGVALTEEFNAEKVKENRLLSWSVMEGDRVARAIVAGIERGAFEVRVQWWMNPLYHLAVDIGPLRRVITKALRNLAGDVA